LTAYGQTKTCHGLARREFKPAGEYNTVELLG
jgi:hypothetical protein